MILWLRVRRSATADAVESFDIGISVQVHVRATFLNAFVQIIKLRSVFTWQSFLRCSTSQRKLTEDGLIAANERVLTKVSPTSVRMFGDVANVEDFAIVVHVGVNSLVRTNERIVDGLGKN